MTAGVLRARVAELADAPHSKCGIERCVGSSPTSGTVFSLFRGLRVAECVQISSYGPRRGPIFVGAVLLAGRLLSSLDGRFVHRCLFMDIPGLGNVT